MKIISIVGARPNFMKIAPLLRAINKYNESNRSPLDTIRHLLVHTGQHYDYEMSQVFFQELQIPQPDTYLAVGSGTHAEQTGKIMIEFEKVLLKQKPDLVVVVGDVNSTLAAALAAALAAVKLHIPIAHIEAGIRCYDKNMPEEINRLLTDAVSDYLFTPSPDADDNLRREGIRQDKIFFVGNIMVDSLLYNKARAAKSDILERLGLVTRHQSPITPYALLTLHRPDNVDDKETLGSLVQAVTEISKRIPVVFPAHPRTQKSLKEFSLLNHLPITNSQSQVASDQSPITNCQLLLLQPLGYLDFLNLEMNAKFVMTDSGGMQVETTALDIPCLTLYRTTGWTDTLAQGTNTLVGTEPERLIQEALKILDGKGKQGSCPELWDGKAAERIVAIITSSR